MVVDTDDRSGEGSYLTEGDEYRIVDLSLGCEASAKEEKRDTGKRKACCCDQLYELVIGHIKMKNEKLKIKGYFFDFECKGSTKMRDRQE